GHARGRDRGRIVEGGGDGGAHRRSGQRRNGVDGMTMMRSREQAGAGPRQSSVLTVLRSVLKSRETGIFCALLATILAFSLLDRSFLSGYNLINIVLQAAVTAILAIASTFVIITAGIDLSVGSMLAVSAV